jgi:uncharacterized protein YciI
MPTTQQDLYRVESDEAARAAVEADPAVRAGVMRAELFPYRVALLCEANAQA